MKYKTFYASLSHNSPPPPLSISLSWVKQPLFPLTLKFSLPTNQSHQATHHSQVRRHHSSPTPLIVDSTSTIVSTNLRLSVQPCFIYFFSNPIIQFTILNHHLHLHCRQLTHWFSNWYFSTTMLVYRFGFLAGLWVMVGGRYLGFMVAMGGWDLGWVLHGFAPWVLLDLNCSSSFFLFLFLFKKIASNLLCVIYGW